MIDKIVYRSRRQKDFELQWTHHPASTLLMLHLSDFISLNAATKSPGRFFLVSLGREKGILISSCLPCSTPSELRELRVLYVNSCWALWHSFYSECLLAHYSTSRTNPCSWVENSSGKKKSLRGFGRACMLFFTGASAFGAPSNSSIDSLVGSRK